MHLETVTKALFVLGGCMTLMTACSEPAENAEDYGGQSAETESEDTSARSDAPVLFDGDEQNASAQQSSYDPCPANAFCDGPIAVTPDGVNLLPDNRGVKLAGTFTVQNRSGSDLQIIMMDRYAAASLNNGVSGTSNPYYPTGLEICRDSGAECFATKPETFRLITPDDSATRLSTDVRLRVEPMMMPSMADVETTDVSFQLFSVDSSGEERLHQVTLPNVKLTNRM